MPANIFTKDISKYLSVPMDVAEKIQDVIDIYFSLDWSEADEFELQATYIAAYEFLKTHSALI